MVKWPVFPEYKSFLCRPRVFSRALGCGARRGAPVCDGASVGPGGAPWRVLWAFKVAKSGKYPQGRFPRSQSRPRQWKTNISRFPSTEPRQNNTRFKFSPFLQRRTLRSYYARVDIDAYV